MKPCINELILAALLGVAFTPDLLAQGTAFTYQGRLNLNGASANGSYDFRFRIVTDPDGDNYLGGPLLTNGLPVVSGLFAANLDFGAGIFTGSDLWLQIEVRTNDAGGYNVLSPLQALTPTPYAIFAQNASNITGTLSSAQLSGTYSSAVTFSNAANSFTGSGAGLTEIPWDSIITNGNFQAAVRHSQTNIAGGAGLANASDVTGGITVNSNLFVLDQIRMGNNGENNANSMLVVTNPYNKAKAELNVDSHKTGSSTTNTTLQLGFNGYIQPGVASMYLQFEQNWGKSSEWHFDYYDPYTGRVFRPIHHRLRYGSDTNGMGNMQFTANQYSFHYNTNAAVEGTRSLFNVQNGLVSHWYYSAEGHESATNGWRIALSPSGSSMLTVFGPQGENPKQQLQLSTEWEKVIIRGYQFTSSGLETGTSDGATNITWMNGGFANFRNPNNNTVTRLSASALLFCRTNFIGWHTSDTATSANATTRIYSPVIGLVGLRTNVLAEGAVGYGLGNTGPTAAQFGGTNVIVSWNSNGMARFDRYFDAASNAVDVLISARP